MPSLALALPPPLHEGDRLDTAEFLRRWEAMPDLKHAELIDGVVFCMPSPVSFRNGDPHRDITVWLWMHMVSTAGCESGMEITWLMGQNNVSQPDAFLRILESHGGQSGNTQDYGAGAPELIVEVSSSTLSRDLGAKLALYCRSGLREYVSVIPPMRRVIWRQLVRGKYREAAPGEDGILRSTLFPGLWLDPASPWSARKSIRAALDRGLKSLEHAAFVKKLAAQAARRRAK